jgi:HlyD family secretion protein
MIGMRFVVISILMSLCFVYGCADVKTVSPARRNIVVTVYASGEIEPENEHWISAEKSGVLLKKYIKEGDSVKCGQILYVITDETRQARVDVALANYKLSSLNTSDSSPVLADLILTLNAAHSKAVNDSTNLRRWQNLWDRGIGTKSNLDNVYTQYTISLNEKKTAQERYLTKLGELGVSKKISESQLVNSKKEFADGFIVSDQDGVVYETLKNAGENVTANEKLLLLGDCTDRVVKLYIDQQDINKIKLGQKVLMRTDQDPDSAFEAKVTFIYPSMNRNDQTFCIEAKMEKITPYFFIHSPVEANIIVDERPDVLILPKEALAGKDSLWIKENKRNRKVVVKTGMASFDYIEVLSGVNEQDKVILDWYKLK